MPILNGKIVRALYIGITSLINGKGKMAAVQQQGGVLNSDGLETIPSDAVGVSSAAFGVGCVANGDSSLAGGYCSATYQVGSVAFGSSIAGNKELQDAFQAEYDTIKAEHPDYTDEQIYALIDNTIKQHKYGFAFAIGSGSEAIGRQSFAGGYLNKAIGNQATALGRENVVNGENSMASGAYNKVSGTTSFTTGHTNEAGSESTFCSGYKNKATNVQAAAIGRENEASGGQSLATGQKTKAAGQCALSGGIQSQANGKCAVSFGQESAVDGQYSFACGYKPYVKGTYAAAFGNETIAQYNTQLVIGKHNEAKNAPFVIGNGTSADDRKNIFSVDWSGGITVGETTLSEANLKKLLALIS